MQNSKTIEFLFVDFGRVVLTFIYFCPVLGADSLSYLSVDGLVRAVQLNLKSKRTNQIGHCTACLTGEYPVLPEELKW